MKPFTAVTNVPETLEEPYPFVPKLLGDPRFLSFPFLEESANTEVLSNSTGLSCLLFSRWEDEKRVVYLMDGAYFETSSNRIN
jgi:hypothetical protein